MVGFVALGNNSKHLIGFQSKTAHKVNAIEELLPDLAAVILPIGSPDYLFSVPREGDIHPHQTGHQHGQVDLADNGLHHGKDTGPVINRRLFLPEIINNKASETANRANMSENVVNVSLDQKRTRRPKSTASKPRRIKAHQYSEITNAAESFLSMVISYLFSAYCIYLVIR